MSDDQVMQPGARLQYDYWKQWPKSHRQPTQEEWLRDYDALVTEHEKTEAELAEANNNFRITFEINQRRASRIDKLEAALREIADADPSPSQLETWVRWVMNKAFDALNPTSAQREVSK